MLDYIFYIPTPRLAIVYPNPANEAHIALCLELYKNYTTVGEDGQTKPIIPDRAAAIKMLQDRAAQIESENGYGRYILAVLPPASTLDDDDAKRVQDAAPVGVVTLNLRGPGAPPLPDIGFNLLPSARGMGYATEAVEGLSRWFEREKGVTELLGYCHDDNEASMKVLKRAGFELLGERDIPTLSNGGSTNRAEQKGLLVWARGLKKGLAEYGL